MSAPVALITGAGQGLGRTIALQLAVAGFDVVINSRSNKVVAQQVADEAARHSVRSLAVIADISDPASIKSMVEQARAELGPIQVLVNNAAVRTRIPFAQLSLMDWRAVQQIDLEGPFLCSQAVLPDMQANRWGRIINILGNNAMAGDPSRVHVSAAKHGLVGLTLALANETRTMGTTVNAVSPSDMKAADPDEAERRRASVAAVIGFLASPQAENVTGQVIAVHCEGE